MKTREKTWKLKNKGFTLIEMIVTVAIIAIFSGVVVTFIGTGSSVYRSTSSSSKVQMETQETFDKIEDLIIDANRSLYYAYGSGSEIGAQITNDIIEKGGDRTNSSENKTFIACNEYENSDGKTSLYIYDVLDWQKSDGKIYYSRRQYTAESSNTAGSDDEAENDTENFSDESEENFVGSGNAGTGNVRNARTLVERSVLASGILDFRADVSKVKSDKIVRFQLSTENGKKQIQTLHSVSLRNNVDLKKPDDAFAKADATNVGIRIINAPDSMNPGESVMLVYGLTGNGSIDPTTVTWTVIDNKDNGSFPSQDHTNGRLTINENGSGYITVQVSAVSSTGQTVTSATVTIKIKETATPSPDPTPELAPKKLIIKTPSLLLGANNQYTLNDIVHTEMVYEDDSVKTEGYTLNWSVQSGSYASIMNGALKINKEAGTAQTGTLLLTATEPDSKLTATLQIIIARIDIKEPIGEYNVGKKKPWGCTYMEGGVEIQGIAPQIKFTKPEGAEEYEIKNGIAQGFFSDSDIGQWNVNVSINLQNRNGYGTVSDSADFSVRSKMPAQIVLNENKADTVVAGQTYSCAPTVKWGFDFKPETSDNFWVNFKIQWSLKKDYPGISIKPKDDTSAEITVDAANKTTHPSGFILCADYIKYTDENKNIEVYRIHDEMEVKVAYALSLQGKGENVYYKDNYYMTLYMLYAYPDGSVGSRVVSEKDKTFGNINWSGKDLDDKDLADVVSERVHADGEKWYYTAEYDIPEHRIKVIVNIDGAENLFFNDRTKTMQADLIVTEKKHTYSVTLEAIDPDNNEQVTSYILNKNIKFVTHVFYDNVEIQDYKVQWNGGRITSNGHEGIYKPQQYDRSLYFQVYIETDNGEYKRTFEVKLNSVFDYSNSW